MIFFVSILSAFGLAVIAVEKGDDWPVSIFLSRIAYFLGKIHPKLPEMFECTVCTSFWASLITDSFLFFLTGGSYFMWPLTGFAACGLSWFIYEFLGAIDKKNAAE